MRLWERTFIQVLLNSSRKWSSRFTICHLSLSFHFFRSTRMVSIKVDFFAFHHECIIQTISVVSNVSGSFHHYSF